MQVDQEKCASAVHGLARRRLLIVATHAVQYAGPLYRQLASRPDLDLTVAYCSLRGAEPTFDADFDRLVRWDVPILNGYQWFSKPESVRHFGIERWLWNVCGNNQYNVILSFLPYTHRAFWVCCARAALDNTPLLVSIDGHSLESRDRRVWKKHLKKRFLPWVQSRATLTLAASTGTVDFLKSLGIDENRIVLTPAVVDNNWWVQQSLAINRSDARAKMAIPPGAALALYCAKLQPWKRPDLLLEAFADAQVPGAYLAFAGDGPLRDTLRDRARILNCEENVRFLGFRNQSELPETYAAADVLVLPSDYEPFGLVVNEAMCCGLGAIVSENVGARYDLVREGITGFTFPAGDRAALSRRLRQVLANPTLARTLGINARERMQSWSYVETGNAMIRAIDQALKLRRS